MGWRRRKEIANTILRSYLPAREEEEVALARGAEVGRHTYGFNADTFPIYTEGARVCVGAFCSIGPRVTIHGGGKHDVTRVTTFPLNARIFDRAKRNGQDDVHTRATVVGNDVWIGESATILAGVAVGDGAVIGAGAVVSKYVEPYAIVVGNPARLVRYRFEHEVRERLLALAWWDWSDEELRARRRWFEGSIEDFLLAAEGAPSDGRRGSRTRTGERPAWRTTVTRSGSRLSGAA